MIQNNDQSDGWSGLGAAGGTSCPCPRFRRRPRQRRIFRPADIMAAATHGGSSPRQACAFLRSGHERAAATRRRGDRREQAPTECLHASRHRPAARMAWAEGTTAVHGAEGTAVKGPEGNVYAHPESSRQHVSRRGRRHVRSRSRGLQRRARCIANRRRLWHVGSKNRHGGLRGIPPDRGGQRQCRRRPRGRRPDRVQRLRHVRPGLARGQPRRWRRQAGRPDGHGARPPGPRSERRWVGARRAARSLTTTARTSPTRTTRSITATNR